MALLKKPLHPSEKLRWNFIQKFEKHPLKQPLLDLGWTKDDLFFRLINLYIRGFSTNNLIAVGETQHDEFLANLVLQQFQTFESFEKDGVLDVSRMGSERQQLFKQNAKRKLHIVHQRKDGSLHLPKELHPPTKEEIYPIRPSNPKYTYNPYLVLSINPPEFTYEWYRRKAVEI